ncbi:MAG: DUF2330 domain-containing protein [Myxococcota bacterium]
MRTLFAFLLGASFLHQASTALACGGFFFSAVTPQPVDQNAERILFRIHDDQTVTAIVEISYTGEAESFSWVVPVPDTPTLDTVPPSTLRLLDQATGVQIIAPPLEDCTSRFSFGGSDDEGTSAQAESGVIVEDLPRVGLYSRRQQKRSRRDTSSRSQSLVGVGFDMR